MTMLLPSCSCFAAAARWESVWVLLSLQPARSPISESEIMNFIVGPLLKAPVFRCRGGDVAAITKLLCRCGLLGLSICNHLCAGGGRCCLRCQHAPDLQELVCLCASELVRCLQRLHLTLGARRLRLQRAKVRGVCRKRLLLLIDALQYGIVRLFLRLRPVRLRIKQCLPLRVCATSRGETRRRAVIGHVLVTRQIPVDAPSLVLVVVQRVLCL